MVVGNPAFTLEELQSFTIDQLRRRCGYLDIKYKKKTTKDALVLLIWDMIMPLPVEGVALINGQGEPVTVQVLRIQQLMEK